MHSLEVLRWLFKLNPDTMDWKPLEIFFLISALHFVDGRVVPERPSSSDLFSDPEALLNFSAKQQKWISDEYLSKGKIVAQEIYELLKEKSKFSIDRYVIGGSIGKGTAVEALTDFDTVFYINGLLPPFPEVLKEFREILDANGYSVLSAGRVSIQLLVDGVDLDVLAAPNLITSKPRPSGPALYLEQGKNAVQKIREMDYPLRDGYNYSTSMTELVGEFIRSQPEFTLDIIRLAKKWINGLPIEGKIGGKSSIMELVATDAAREALRQDGFSSTKLAAFRGFLKNLIDYENLHIFFNDYYKLDDVPDELLNDLPFIIEAANPFNNFGLNLREPQLSQVKEFARETLHKLNLASKPSFYSENNQERNTAITFLNNVFL